MDVLHDTGLFLAEHIPTLNLVLTFVFRKRDDGAANDGDDWDEEYEYFWSHSKERVELEVLADCPAIS